MRWVRPSANMVRLGKTGQLSISEALLEQIGGPDLVELLFDPVARRIGVRGRAGPHTARVNRTPKRCQARVSLAGLLAHYGVPLPERRAVLKASIEDGVLVFGLDQVGAAS